MEEKVCKMCGEPLPAKAKVCVNCGSPTRRFSRLCHIHRSLITTIGSFLVAVTVAALIYNLLIAQKTLNYQIRTFRETYQPRFEIIHRRTERLSADSIKIVMRFENKGGADAHNVRKNIYLTMIPNADTIKDYISSDNLIRGTGAIDVIKLPDVFGKTFFLSYDVLYKWAGSDSTEHFERSYSFKYLSDKDKYEVRRSSNEIIEGFLDFVESMRTQTK